MQQSGNFTKNRNNSKNSKNVVRYIVLHVKNHYWDGGTPDSAKLQQAAN